MVRGRLVVARRNTSYRSSESSDDNSTSDSHPRLNFCEISLRRRGTMPGAARIVVFDEERKVVPEKILFSGNYLQEAQLG